MLESEKDIILADLMQFGWTLKLPPVSTRARDIGLALGPIMPNQRTGSSHADLVPYSKSDAPPGSMSSMVGKNAQPIHSDGAHTSVPPHYLIFECLEPGSEECPTHIWAIDLDKIIADRNPLLVAPQWVFGSKDRGFYSSIVQRKLSTSRIRFDPLCMTPAAFCRSSLVEAESLIGSYSSKFSIDWIAGAILIVDNWRCLHARGSGAEGSPTRKLRRWQVGDSNGMG